jgi:hypothetical protein
LSGSKQALKEREKKQIAFIAECTLDNVVVDEKGPKALTSSSSKSRALQTIKGACINKLGASILDQFCNNNKIEDCQKKTKLQCCEMIVKKKRHGYIDEGMYPKDFKEEMDDND